MSETIKVVLEADSTKLEAALRKGASMVEKFDQQLARTNSGRTSGSQLPGLELSPSTLRSLETASARTSELARQAERAGGGGRAGAMGFLAFSQAVEDSQYGIRGILNNIPQMVLGFGGTMGLAGAISLAAVAAVTLYPVLKRLFDITDADALAAANAEWEKTYKTGMEVADALREQASAGKLALDLANQHNTALSQRLALTNGMTGAYDAELAAARATRDMQAEIAAARERQVTENGGDARPLIAARQQGEMASIDADLKNRTAELARASSEVLSIGEKRRNIAAETAAAEAASTEEIIRQTEKLAAAKADLARAETIRKAASATNTRGAFTGNPKEVARQNQVVLAATAKIQKTEEVIAALKAEQTAAKEAGATAVQAADAAIAAYDQKINKTTAEVEELKNLRAQREALNKIERENVAFAAAKKELAGLKEETGDLKKKADTAIGQEQAVDAIADEIELLREANAQGGEKLRNIREEISLRKEAASLAASTGMSEADARSILREQQAALKNADMNTGTISERRQKRSDERAEERQRKRDERVAEAQRKRDAKGPDGKPVDLKPANDLDRLRKEAAEKREKANADILKNAQKQTAVQERIEKTLAGIGAA